MTTAGTTDLPRLPPRRPDANKGDFGRVLVVAGSRSLSGAAILCARSALRGGAGLVRLAVPEGILAVVAGGDPCYTLAPLPQDDEGRLSRRALPALETLLQANTVAAIGPGLGQSSELREVLAGILA
jgi:NAD(P)H-hydrate epimerase